MWRKAFFIAILAIVKCSPVHENGVAENFVGSVSDCIDQDTSLCLKEKALKITERLAILKDLDIFEGMSLVNIGSSRSARSYEPLAEDPKARETQIDERIVDNVGDFLDNHVIQLRLTSPEDEEESRSLDEEGRSKKKKKMKKLAPLMMLMKMKFAAMIPMFLGVIAMMAVKSVFLGKIAFAMSAFNMVRKMMAKKHSGDSGSISYGAPQRHEEHPGYSYEPAQGWSRAASDSASLAYSGYKTQ